MYVTNQKCIVERAKYCHATYHTIVNNVPKDKNHYNNDLKTIAIIDNKLAASQRDIGESTNVAQLCLSYWYTTGDDKYTDYSNILANICQIAIDSSKRSFDINVPEEIKRVKDEINIKKNGYPAFWRDIRKDCNKNLINYNLRCPMNSVHSLTIGRAEYKNDTLSISDFFINYENEETQKKSKSIERLIEKYNLEIIENQKNKRKNKEVDYILLRSDYEDMLEDIRRISLPNKYMGLMSWLINRCFMITPGTIRNKDKIQTKLSKNRPLLLKILYDLNPNLMLKCFKKG